MYNSWKSITSSEQSRREIINIACEGEGNVSVSTPSTISIYGTVASKRAKLISPIKISLSCDVGEDLLSSEAMNVANKSF